MTAIRRKPSSEPSRVKELRAELMRKISPHTIEEGDIATALPGLRLYRRSEPTACATATYQPSMIVFVQGRKRIHLGKNVLLCDNSTFLLTSIDLPVVSQVIEATPQAPILGLILGLEMAEVRKILGEEEFPTATVPSSARGMAVGAVTAEILSACVRLLDLLDSPRDIPFLGSLIQREIIYRLLSSPQGGHLRAIATLGERSHSTARAVTWLRANYAKPLRVEELASISQMGVSTLHHHFRSLTAMSPLQYQKHLRLHVARERMLHEGLDAASAAFEVGYQSASQFNREYSRFFGLSPMRDVRAQRLAIAETVRG